MSISVNINELFGQYERRIDLAIKKVSFDLLGMIVQGTPVDTGRARGGWQVGINEEPSGDTPLDRSGNLTMARGEAQILSASIGDSINIVNRVPYIEALERGHSQQAPRGMVYINVMQVRANLAGGSL
jgi:hypothetical protein